MPLTLARERQIGGSLFALSLGSLAYVGYLVASEPAPPPGTFRCGTGEACTIIWCLMTLGLAGYTFATSFSVMDPKKRHDLLVVTSIFTGFIAISLVLAPVILVARAAVTAWH